MRQSPSVERHLIRVLGGIACVAVLGVLAILPIRLYQRDIRHATVHAHRVSSVVHTALSHGLIEGDDLGDLINRFQGIADLEIRLRPLATGETHPAGTSQKGSSHLDGTILRFLAPPLLDRDGRTWLAEMTFDLSPMKRESIRLIVDLLLAVALGSAVFSAAVFLLVRRALVTPLREITRTIEASCEEGATLHSPDFSTREMEELAEAVARCRRIEGTAG